MAAEKTTEIATPEFVIAPQTAWGLDVRELWRHRELIYFLTKRELQVRYKQSFFGVTWAVLQPLAFAGVFALFFSQVFNFTSGDIPYPVLAIVGIVPWLFTANAVQNAAMSLVLDADLISKVYFPRLALPISKALSLGIDLAIALLVVILVVLLYGVAIPPTAPLVVVFLGLGLVTAFAYGTLLAAANVKYRDVAVAVPMIVQIGFFVTPVIYLGTGPDSLIQGDWQYLWALNPMVSVINEMRWALLGTPAPPGGALLISVSSALITLIVSLRYFQRTQRHFADII